MWHFLWNDKESGVQFLNCDQKNKNVLNSVTILFFFLNPKQSEKAHELTLLLAMIVPMTTYDIVINVAMTRKKRVGGDDDFDGSVGGDDHFDDCY